MAAFPSHGLIIETQRTTDCNLAYKFWCQKDTWLALAGVAQSDGVLSRKPEGGRFDDQSGHILRFWVLSLVGVRRGDN